MKRTALKIMTLFLSAQGLLLSGCGLDASISNLSKTAEESDHKQTKSGQAEMTQTEFITTASGYKIQGTWNELAQKKKLANGYQVEGVFYE
ncbi:hypothetical protein [Bdellovibrio sp. BCCA]|uniref:hypothetical protein n=1 Tax=Bdellovibrio sp. BCCA TaxID=3136281 RepID=UPI0030F053F7